MAEKLKIDLEKLKQKILNLETMEARFESFGNNPFGNNLVAIEAMNTDFLGEFKDLLEDLNDDNSKLEENISKMTSMAKTIQQEFERIDDEMAKSLGPQV